MWSWYDRRRYLEIGAGQRPKNTKSRHANAIAEVQALLGSRPRERHLLIEFLHLIRIITDTYQLLIWRPWQKNSVSAKLKFTVATFYAHFDVVHEDETPPSFDYSGL